MINIWEDSLTEEEKVEVLNAVFESMEDEEKGRKIILYSTHCPKCKVIEMKLNKLGLDFFMVDNPDEVVAKGEQVGILSAPLLEVDGKVMAFADAVKFLNEVK